LATQKNGKRLTLGDVVNSFFFFLLSSSHLLGLPGQQNSKRKLLALKRLKSEGRP
jgi:hypothetical protein